MGGRSSEGFSANRRFSGFKSCKKFEVKSNPSCLPAYTAVHKNLSSLQLRVTDWSNASLGDYTVAGRAITF